jgi:hypothetical protein
MKRLLLSWPLIFFLLFGGLAANLMLIEGRKHEYQETDLGAAAKAVAIDYLAGMSIVVEEPIIEGNKGTVQASILDRDCALELMRSEGTKSARWSVVKVDCHGQEASKASLVDGMPSSDVSPAWNWYKQQLDAIFFSEEANKVD